jgi:hypothetical protein
MEQALFQRLAISLTHSIGLEGRGASSASAVRVMVEVQSRGSER